MTAGEGGLGSHEVDIPDGNAAGCERVSRWSDTGVDRPDLDVSADLLHDPDNLSDEWKWPPRLSGLDAPESHREPCHPPRLRGPEFPYRHSAAP